MFYLFLSNELLFFTSPYSVGEAPYLSFIIFLNFVLLKTVFDTAKTFWSLIFSQSSFNGEIHLLVFFFFSFSFSSVHGIYFYQFDSEDTLQMFLSWFGYIKPDFQRYLFVNISGHLETDLQSVYHIMQKLVGSLMSVGLWFFMPLSMRLYVVICLRERLAGGSILSKTAC